MVNDSDIPIIGAPKEEEIILPQVDDKVRYIGKSSVDVIPLTDLVSLGFTDSSKIEYYLGDRKGSYYIKLLPKHNLEFIGWKNQHKGLKPEDTPPELPRRVTYTDKGFMYDINSFFDKQYNHIQSIISRDITSKINIFASNKKKREEDPWR